MDRIDEFRDLHRSGMFVMPNPWDRGTALMLQDMGFPALATTSAGLARTLGKADHQVTRDELVAHVAGLTGVLTVPLSVDSERLFPGDPGGVAETVRLLADAGAAGCSIEDHDAARATMPPIDEAAAAVATAAAACAERGLVLTARTENFLVGRLDLDDTVERLRAYRAAGAEVVYAPGLADAADIARVVTEVGGPVNVLVMPSGPTPAELPRLGVRRLSTGSSLAGVAYDALRRRAGDLLGAAASTAAAPSGG